MGPCGTIWTSSACFEPFLELLKKFPILFQKILPYSGVLGNFQSNDLIFGVFFGASETLWSFSGKFKFFGEFSEQFSSSGGFYGTIEEVSDSMCQNSGNSEVFGIFEGKKQSLLRVCETIGRFLFRFKKFRVFCELLGSLSLSPSLPSFSRSLFLFLLLTLSLFLISLSPHTVSLSISLFHCLCLSQSLFYSLSLYMYFSLSLSLSLPPSLHPSFSRGKKHNILELSHTGVSHGMPLATGMLGYFSYFFTGLSVSEHVYLNSMHHTCVRDLQKSITWTLGIIHLWTTPPPKKKPTRICTIHGDNFQRGQSMPFLCNSQKIQQSKHAKPYVYILASLFWYS